jgi:hypothetical protein
VAARFATNWLQIWHFNPTILHPDSALPPNTLINIGHLYEVRRSFFLWCGQLKESLLHVPRSMWDMSHMPLASASV